MSEAWGFTVQARDGRIFIEQPLSESERAIYGEESFSVVIHPEQADLLAKWLKDAAARLVVTMNEEAK